MPTDALHHLVINLDVQDSGQRTNSGQLTLRSVIYDVVRSAFTATGIDLPQSEDRGDGVLLVLPAAVHKKQVVGSWVEELYQALRERNLQFKEPIRVRIGIHAGEVHHDDYGVAGIDVNIACRLASCKPAKGILLAAPDVNLVVAVSDAIYQSVVRHGGRYIDPDSYRQHPLRTAEFDGSAWLYVPGYSIPPRPTIAPEPTPAPPTLTETTPRGTSSMTNINCDSVVNQSTFHDLMINKSDRGRRAP